MITYYLKYPIWRFLLWAGEATITATHTAWRVNAGVKDWLDRRIAAVNDRGYALQEMALRFYPDEY
ncbi:MAG: hypothetical protein WCF85_10810 [Rhodospirillaceae bacterium]